MAGRCSRIPTTLESRSVPRIQKFMNPGQWLRRAHCFYYSRSKVPEATPNWRSIPGIGREWTDLTSTGSLLLFFNRVSGAAAVASLERFTYKPIRFLPDFVILYSQIGALRGRLLILSQDSGDGALWSLRDQSFHFMQRLGGLDLACSAIVTGSPPCTPRKG